MIHHDQANQQLVGTISLGQIIRLPKSLVLKDVMEPEIRTIPARNGITRRNSLT